MLVIRRKTGECVLVGEGIEVHVLEITATRVKLGFVAPHEVTVVRREMELAGKQNQAAADLPDHPPLAEWARAFRPPPE